MSTNEHIEYDNNEPYKLWSGVKKRGKWKVRSAIFPSTTFHSSKPKFAGGVSFHKHHKRYHAYFRHSGHQVFLGAYKLKRDATERLRKVLEVLNNK